MVKKILHTSDWHIGRRLKAHERYDEFAKFFEWLENLISIERVDALLVAGDIFDNSTPSAKAQSLYYSFLGRIAQSNCRHIIITSGNHDSPAFIDAPKELLKLCNVYVVGTPCENPEDEVIKLNDELIVCAVPYLRDRDIRTLKADDNIQDLARALQEGIAEHYRRVFERAKELQGNSNIPVIAMGHLFAKGGRYRNDEGVRSLYLGTAVEVRTEIFPEFLTYTALGHLHSPQKVGRDNIRYSGSPIAMNFGEVENKNAVYIIELDGKNLAGIREINVPVFQKLRQIRGNLDEITTELQKLIAQNESIWLEVVYSGSDPVGNLRDKLNELIRLYPLIEIFDIIDESKNFYNPTTIYEEYKTLENIKPMEMFKLLLDAQGISEKQREAYIPMYEKILHKLEID